jgi:hypothetical protein
MCGRTRIESELPGLLNDFRICLVVAAFVLLGFALPGVFSQPPKVEGRAVAKPVVKPQLTLKVFKLERATPESVMQGMGSLLEDQRARQAG